MGIVGVVGIDGHASKLRSNRVDRERGRGHKGVNGRSLFWSNVKSGASR